MKERVINDNITIPADNQPTIIAQPRKSPLVFIATLIPSNLTAIIIFLPLIHSSIWANHINSPVFQLFAKPVAVAAIVVNKAFGIFSGSLSAITRHGDIVQRFFEQFDFRCGRNSSQ
jgi:hypothetical protein